MGEVGLRMGMEWDSSGSWWKLAHNHHHRPSVSRAVSSELVADCLDVMSSGFSGLCWKSLKWLHTRQVVKNCEYDLKMSPSLQEPILAPEGLLAYFN